MADVRRTRVQPGPLDKQALRNFQKSFGIEADGRFGAQSMAQVEELRLAWGRTLGELRRARRQSVWLLLLGAAVPMLLYGLWRGIAG